MPTHRHGGGDGVVDPGPGLVAVVRGEVGGARAIEGFAHAREVDGRELDLGERVGGGEGE